jgi:hypothetical protein
MAETRDLKAFLPPANHPVSGFPLSAQPLTANRYYLLWVGAPLRGVRSLWHVPITGQVL